MYIYIYICNLRLFRRGPARQRLARVAADGGAARHRAPRGGVCNMCVYIYIYTYTQTYYI